MDYDVFLVSRIHEEWTRTNDHSHSVREGLASTGKVITAAAAIMIVVFAAFVLSPDRLLQRFGLGLATHGVRRTPRSAGLSESGSTAYRPSVQPALAAMTPGVPSPAPRPWWSAASAYRPPPKPWPGSETG